jgi:hypothetical protein
MNLEQIKEQWSKDCEIDDIELDSASLEVPKLHAKYQDLLTSKILVSKQYEAKYNILLKDKWLWYNGKLDADKISAYGWEHDPFDGLKVMKTDMSYFFNADPDLQEMGAKREYLQVTINYIKECMTNITWRHQTIRNTIDWRKFMAGQ